MRRIQIGKQRSVIRQSESVCYIVAKLDRNIHRMRLKLVAVSKVKSLLTANEAKVDEWNGQIWANSAIILTFLLQVSLRMVWINFTKSVNTTSKRKHSSNLLNGVGNFRWRRWRIFDRWFECFFELWDFFEWTGWSEYVLVEAKIQHMTSLQASKQTENIDVMERVHNSQSVDDKPRSNTGVY